MHSLAQAWSALTTKRRVELDSLRSPAREDEAVIGTDPRVTTSPATALNGNWALRTFLELGALPTAVPCARLHTRQVLWEWHLDVLAGTAELIVSELVTNAVHASAGLTGSRRAGAGYQARRRYDSGLPPTDSASLSGSGTGTTGSRHHSTPDQTPSPAAASCWSSR